MGNIISVSYKTMVELQPKALLILGDTNSCLSMIGAKRMHIPIIHMEAILLSCRPSFRSICVIRHQHLQTFHIDSSGKNSGTILTLTRSGKHGEESDICLAMDPT